MTENDKKQLELRIRLHAKKFIRQANVVSEDTAHASKTVQKWLEKGNLSEWTGVNSLGVLQVQGPMLDVRCAQLCELVEILRTLK